MNYVEKYSCRKLLKSCQIVEDEGNELIELTEIVNDDVLDTHLAMAGLFKNDRKHKFNGPKDEYLHIECRFLFVSVARVETLFSHGKFNLT